MTIALAATWLPRGELARFQRLHAQMLKYFSNVVLIMPSDADELAAIAGQMPEVEAVASDRWQHGRTEALKKALEKQTSHILYSDFDRLLHWLEVYPDELAHVLKRVEDSECLVIGRTTSAFASHPRCLRDTERIINDVFRHVTGLSFDICVAARGFSRGAVERIIARTRARSALGVDGEWLYILHKAGYPLEYIEVEGMEWETPDQYRPFAADLAQRQEAADSYDESTANWAQRVYVAQQIIGSLLQIAEE
jgi:hypothetical protein